MNFLTPKEEVEYRYFEILNVLNSKKVKSKSQHEPPFQNCRREITNFYSGILRRKFNSLSFFHEWNELKKYANQKSEFQSVKRTFFTPIRKQKKQLEFSNTSCRKKGLFRHLKILHAVITHSSVKFEIFLVFSLFFPNNSQL